MADDITVNTLSGSPVVSTDNEAGSHVQYVKLKFGGDGTFTKVATGAGLPVVLDTLISGEDQTNNLLKVSGGAVRITSLGSVTSATSSTPVAVPNGPKTFMGQIVNGTSETKAITADLYGNWENSTTGGVKLATLTLGSTPTVTHLEDALPVITANFAFYYYTVTTYTSASAAPFTIRAMY